MNKKELLDKRPLMPKLSLVGYILCSLIAIGLIIMGAIVLSNDLKFKTDGEEVEAKVVDIVENDYEKKIYITYDYAGITYSRKDLKYWNDELDIDSTIKIKVLKSNPEEFRANEKYSLIAYLIFGIALILIALSLREFIKFYKEHERVYKLLTEGEKQEGVVVSVEQVSERNVYGTLPWCITAKINDKVFNGCKNYIKFSLKGAIGYLVDIYIDKNNETNFYIDLISIRRDKDNNVKEVDKYEE